MLLLGMLFFCISCNKKNLLDVGSPSGVIVSPIVYKSDANAADVLTGLYYIMSSGGPATGELSCTYYGSLSADEFTLSDQDELAQSAYKNALTSANVPLWTQFYNYIFHANAAIEGLSNSTALTLSVKQQLMGEAKFIRGLCYFYLVNFFGKVPLVVSTDYKVNKGLSCADMDAVYIQIATDLEAAQTLLSDQYLEANVTTLTSERLRPTRWAAIALLARVQLFRRNWAAAITAAKTVIDHTSLFDIAPLNEVFLKNSKEAIWQLQPVNGKYTEDGQLFISSLPVYISPSLLQAFEPHDLRKSSWLKSNSREGNPCYPFKYKTSREAKTITEYLMVLRITEQYLIRAEAFVQLGDLAGARADLNVIRHRAGLANTTASTSAELLAAIMHERQVEFFAEWGHRWLDLKRTGTVDAVMERMTTQKGGSWKTYLQLYPIPQSDLLLNTHLKQNVGYE